LKILWISPVTPFTPTGYGRVSYYLPRELEKLGHEVHMLSSRGLDAGRFTIDGFRLYAPIKQGALVTDQAVRLFKELEADIAIYMADFWPYAESLAALGKEIPLILHSPIDHFPVVKIETIVINEAMMLATLSHCGVQWAKEAGCENVMYAPHGCNLDIYKPGDKKTARAALGWPEDKFIYLTVATNKGDRKNLAGLLRAYCDMLLKRPELGDKTRLALHTYPYEDEYNQEGYDLWNVAASLGILPNTLWTEPMKYLLGLPESQVALMYQAADVHVLPSKTEGFGLPLIEAGACGIPSIASNFASMPEIVGKDGWLIDVADLEVQQLIGYSWQAIPSTKHLSKVMERVYDNPWEVEVKGEAMRCRVCDEYSWTKAASYWPEILERAMASKHERYKKFYLAIAERDKKNWEDKARPNYEADVWYNANRNSIGWDMLGEGNYGKLLDLGCRGEVECLFANVIRATQRIGIDIVPCKCRGMKTYEVDACDTGFFADSFDIVICREVIEHVPDDKALLSEIWRVLKPGGILFITTPNGLNVPPDGKEHLRAYAPDEFLNVLMRSGFNILDKRGNVPDIFKVLLKQPELLPEFQKRALTHTDFYDSTQMFVKAVKV